MNKKAIEEEINAYFAINGETGAWGESMRDGIAVDIILEMLETGHNIESTPELRAEIERRIL